jgi:tRNA G18 (ribose-2'-O)-methylase SpoU
MASGIESLNAAVAIDLILFEVVHQSRTKEAA